MNRMMGRSCSKEAAPDDTPPKAEAPISLPPELTRAGAPVSRTHAPAKSEEKRETVSADDTGRGA
jgi:hypothetical protein